MLPIWMVRRAVARRGRVQGSSRPTLGRKHNPPEGANSTRSDRSVRGRQMALEPVDQLALAGQSLGLGDARDEPRGPVDLGERLQAARPRGPLELEGVAGDGGRVEVALQRVGRDDLAVALDDVAQVDRVDRPAAAGRSPRRTRAGPRSTPARRRTRPWGCSRRRRPCGPRTARPCGRAAPRCRRRYGGRAGCPRW